LVICGFWPYCVVRIRTMNRQVSTVRCSRAWCRQSNRTSGSASSVATLSLIFTAQMVRPSKDVPMLNSFTSWGKFAAAPSRSAFVSL
jgi:hypothetical protein